MKKLWNRRFAGNIASLAVSLAVSALLFEAVTRIFFPQRTETPVNYYISDPELGWKLRSNIHKVYSATDFKMEVNTNKKGFRDLEHKYEKSPDTFRIVGIGDSMLFGHGVDYEDIVIVRLKKIFLNDDPSVKKVEVINLGVPGYNSSQYEKSLKIEGFRYDPDLVIMFFYVGNDWSVDEGNDYKGVNIQVFLINSKRFYAPDEL